MKKTIILLLFAAILSRAFPQTAMDTLKGKLNEHTDLLSSYKERLENIESDLGPMSRVKFTGYVQAQFQNYEDKAVYPNDYFSIRRARIKFTYVAGDGLVFGIQPDFTPGNIGVIEAYAILNEHWIKNEYFKNAISLWAGKFNRVDYEVEYNPSFRSPEESKVVQVLYPGDAAVGAKLEVHPNKIPIHLWLAIFNGDALTIKDSSGNTLYAQPNYGSPNENSDYDNFKDIMFRLTYNLKMGNFGELDFGGHGYIGQLKSNSTYTLNSDYKTLTAVALGSSIARTWYGGEMQFYVNALGGMSLKAEYIAGKNASDGYIGPKGTIMPNFQNDFMGYYLWFTKEINKSNEFVLRYDIYDPNTDISGSQIGVVKYAGLTTGKPSTTIDPIASGKGDVAITTISPAWNFFFGPNLRLTVAYQFVLNEKVGENSKGVGNVVTNYTLPNGTKGVDDYSTTFDQNLLTIRLQAKF